MWSMHLDSFETLVKGLSVLTLLFQVPSQQTMIRFFGAAFCKATVAIVSRQIELFPLCGQVKRKLQVS